MVRGSTMWKWSECDKSVKVISSGLGLGLELEIRARARDMQLHFHIFA